MHNADPSLTDDLCRRILERTVNIDDLAAEEHAFCALDKKASTGLGSLAFLETLQDIRRSYEPVLRWAEIIEWCRRKSRTAHPEMRPMYEDAMIEFLTSAAHSFYHQIPPQEQAQILLDSADYSDPAEYLFSALHRRYGPNEAKDDTITA